MRAGVKSENWQKATKTMFFVVFLWGAGTCLLVELFFWANDASEMLAVICTLCVIFTS